MSGKSPKKRQIRNKTKDMLSDYYITNKEYTEENKRRQHEETDYAEKKKMSFSEKILIAVIVLGCIGIVIKYIIL